MKKYLDMENIKIDSNFQSDMHKYLPVFIDQISRFDNYYEASYHDYINYFGKSYKDVAYYDFRKKIYWSKV